MPSEALTQILSYIPADFADPAADYNAVRATMAPAHGHPVPDGITVTEATLSGVRSAWVDRAGSESDRVAFHCHGGALVSCSLDDYLFYGALIVQQLGLRVVMPDYRLAPEDPFPAAYDDCFNAYRGLLETGVDPARICVMGDSCGGGLAIAAIVRARDEGLPLPGCFVSVSGWFDLTDAGLQVSEGDPFLSPGWVRNRGVDYTAGRVGLDDPRVSPARADLSGLPPLYLPLAQHETVGPGTVALAGAAARQGVKVVLETFPGAVHGWQGLVTSGVPEAVDVWRRTMAFIDAFIPPRPDGASTPAAASLDGGERSAAV
jgi:acetyl esterase/lipase